MSDLPNVDDPFDWRILPPLCSKNKKKARKKKTKRKGRRKSRQRAGISRKSKRNGDDDGEGDLQSLRVSGRRELWEEGKTISLAPYLTPACIREVGVLSRCSLEVGKGDC